MAVVILAQAILLRGADLIPSFDAMERKLTSCIANALRMSYKMKLPTFSLHLKAASGCVAPTSSADSVVSTAAAGVRGSPVVLSIYDHLARCQSTCGDAAAPTEAYICGKKRGSVNIRDVTTQTHANMITKAEVRQVCELLSVQAQEKDDRMEQQFIDRFKKQEGVLRQQTQLIVQLRDKDSDEAGVSQSFHELHSACLQLPRRRRQQPVIRSADMQARKTEMPALLKEAGEAMGINSCFLTPADMQALWAVSIMHRRGAEHSVQRS